VPVDEAEAAPEAILVARHRDDVHVVGHQAVGPDFDAGAFGGIGQQVEIERIIAFLEERPLLDHRGTTTRRATPRANHFASGRLAPAITPCNSADSP